MKPGGMQIKSRREALRLLSECELERCIEIGPYVWRCQRKASPGRAANFERADDTGFQHDTTRLADIVMEPEIKGRIFIRALATEPAADATGSRERTPFKVLGERRKRVKLSVTEKMRQMVEQRLTEVVRQLGVVDERRAALLKEREELAVISKGLSA